MIIETPADWPIPSSVRYHALALCLRVGDGTILPSADADADVAHGSAPGASTNRTDMEAMPTQMSYPCDVHEGDAHADDTPAMTMDSRRAHNQAAFVFLLTMEAQNQAAFVF